MSRPKIVLVSLGGTITMTCGSHGRIAPTLLAADLLRSVPALDSFAEIEALSPLRLPGASLTIDHLLDLGRLIDERLSSGASRRAFSSLYCYAAAATDMTWRAPFERTLT